MPSAEFWDRGFLWTRCRIQRCIVFGFLFCVHEMFDGGIRTWECCDCETLKELSRRLFDPDIVPLVPLPVSA